MNKVFKYLTMYAGAFRKRDKKLIVFGAWLGERFADNPKQMFIEANKYKELHSVWITKSEAVVAEIEALGYEACLFGSEKAINYQKNAGYAIISNGISDLEHTYLGGAVILDFWHGVPLKYIGIDSEQGIDYKPSLAFRFKWFLKYMVLGNIYYFPTSETFVPIYERTFRQPSDHIRMIGQPRNDVFFEGEIKPYFEGKNIILYAPTHRLEGAKPLNISELFDLDDLQRFLEKNDYYFIVKKHFYHRNEKENLEKYDRIIDITEGDYDIQRLVIEAKLLISDYSSIYIDYLLLDKPLMFYCFDYEDYLKNDRNMYFNYEDVTPGGRVNDYRELRAELDEFATFGREYKSKSRRQIRDFFYCREGQGKISDILVEEIISGRYM